jgi:hypothetical protein
MARATLDVDAVLPHRARHIDSTREYALRHDGSDGKPRLRAWMSRTTHRPEAPQCFRSRDHQSIITNR